jgi:hypothetical protein
VDLLPGPKRAGESGSYRSRTPKALRAGIVALLLVAGCTTLSPTPEAYTRDGVTYGATEGTFRGRWWNYYERGRSFADGGFWAEAEADFRTALAQRDVDQWWARTYGLHFVNEYFPTRELGIALLQQGQVDGAVQALESSLAQEHSARAAFYLDEARAQRVQESGIDSAAPVIELLSPKPGEALSTLAAEFVFAARDDTYVRELRINGVAAPIDVSAPEIQVTRNIAIPAGDATVIVEAIDITGKRSVETFTFATDHDGPAIGFNVPVVVPGMVTGTAYDPAGVDKIEIGGAQAAVSKSGERVTFTVDLQHVDTTVPLRFTATDTLGNTTSGAVPTDRLVLSGGKRTWSVGFASAPTTLEHNGLRAHFVDGRPVAITRVAQADAAPLAIDFTNLADGQRYLKDEIIVSLHIASGAEIAEVTLNDTPVPGILPEVRDQRISRRILVDAMGPATITATVRDTTGAEATRQVQIERVPTAVEELDRKLSLAILGNVWEGANPGLAEEANFITDELTRILYERRRFDLVSRDTMPEVLAEQELAAALGKGPASSKLIPAELMVAGRIRRGADSFEIVLQAVDPQTSQILAYADVAGHVASRADLAQLVGDLALRLEQEFPRVQGSVVQVRGANRLSSTLAVPDRVKRNMHCIVYRKGEEIIHPQTGASLGAPAEVLAEGWIEEVQQQLSTIALPPATETLPIQVNDLVLTK